jgi:hypothetical protein
MSKINTKKVAFTKLTAQIEKGIYWPYRQDFPNALSRTFSGF